MKKFLFSFVFLFLTLHLFAQKAEYFSFKCGEKKYSFTGYMIGDPKPKTELQNVYYYSLNSEKAEFYQLVYSKESGNPLISIQKINVFITPFLEKLTYLDGAFNVVNAYGGPKNTFEYIYDCDLNRGYDSVFYEFQHFKEFVMNKNQATEFRKILNSIKFYEYGETDMIWDDDE